DDRRRGAGGRVRPGAAGPAGLIAGPVAIEYLSHSERGRDGPPRGRGMAKTPSGRTSGRGQRDLKVRVKTAKGRKLSSTLWLERQLNDPYVSRARKEGYRGRAA